MAAADPSDLPGYVGTVSDLIAAEVATNPLVIAGIGDAAEQDGTLAGGSADNVYDQSVVIYFDKGSTNETQLQSFAVDMKGRALASDATPRCSTSPQISGATSH